MFLKIILMAKIFSSFAQAQVQAQASALSQMNYVQTKVEQTLRKMSVNEKIGQILLVGFRGVSVSASESIKNDILKFHVGSVILFEYDAMLKTRPRNILNPEQLKTLTTDLQKLSPRIPLFISVDEEGGLVNRLKPMYGFIGKKSAMELGKGTAEETFQHTLSLASELKAHGINLNFSPSVDVNVNPENPVIGKVKRSFSADAKTVVEHAEAVIEAHRAQGVLSVLKHFPGHGSSRSDSHLGMVDVTDTWQAQELLPYEQLIAQNQVDFIMSAHVFQRHLDPVYPATLSEKVLTDLLRNKLNFQGVIISDDMDMGAIKDHYGFEEAIEKALSAGIDILLFGNNINYDSKRIEQVQAIILKLLHSGKFSEEALNDKVRRILTAKAKIGLL